MKQLEAEKLAKRLNKDRKIGKTYHVAELVQGSSTDWRVARYEGGKYVY